MSPAPSVALRAETSDQTACDQLPAVDQHKEDELEGQGNHDWWQHHHTHGHEHRCNYQIDDQERQVEQEPDFKGAAQFTDHEGGDQNAQAQLFRCFRDRALASS